MFLYFYFFKKNILKKRKKKRKPQNFNIVDMQFNITNNREKNYKLRFENYIQN